MEHTTTPTTPRLLPACLMVWLLPAMCLVDTALAALVAGWRPYGTIEHGMMMVLVVWGASIVVLAVRGNRRYLALRWRELLLLGGVSACCWVVLEIAADRTENALRPQAPFHTRGSNIHNVFHPDPENLPGIHGPSRFTTGPLGIRAAARPREGQVRILCIGGSTTECVYLDDTETWPALLPEYAGLGRLPWVGNVGVSGFDTLDHRQFVESSPLLDGVAALVVQPGINDLWRYLAAEEDQMNYGRFHAERNENLAQDSGAYRPWWTRSRLIQLYHTWRQPPPPPEQQEGIGGREYAIRRQKRAEAEMTDALPSLDAGLSAYRARIGAIVDACRKRGVPVLFTTQAVAWDEALPSDAAGRCWFGWLPDGRYLTLGALRRAMDAYNTVLMEECARESVPCVDLSPLNGNPELFYDDCHFSEAGARRVAERTGPALAALLQEHDQ